MTPGAGLPSGAAVRDANSHMNAGWRSFRDVADSSDSARDGDIRGGDGRQGPPGQPEALTADGAESEPERKSAASSGNS
jgi:hypothetical protein